VGPGAVHRAARDGVRAPRLHIVVRGTPNSGYRQHDFFRCEAGYEARADVVATTSCKNLVVDMHYEARIQAIVSCHGSILGEKVTKQDARTMSLTRDQYLLVNTEL
jgi:hypothetical protein